MSKLRLFGKAPKPAAAAAGGSEESTPAAAAPPVVEPTAPPAAEEPAVEPDAAEVLRADVGHDIGVLSAQIEDLTGRVAAAEAQLAAGAAVESRLEALEGNRSEEVAAAANEAAVAMVAEAGVPAASAPAAAGGEAGPQTQEEFYETYRAQQATDPRGAARYWATHAERFGL